MESKTVDSSKDTAPILFKWLSKPVPFIYINDPSKHCIAMDLEFSENKEAYTVIGVGALNYYLTDFVNPEPDKFFVLHDKEKSTFFISLDNTPDVFWYQFATKEEIEEILPEFIKTYNPKEYPVHTRNNKIGMIEACGFIGTERLFQTETRLDKDKTKEYKLDDKSKFTILEDEFVKNDYTEIFFWGSYWCDYPYSRKCISDYAHVVKLINTSTKQVEGGKYYSTSFRTIYSKSVIELRDEYGAYIAFVKYIPTIKNNHIKEINKKFQRDYPLDMPVDVILVLQKYPFVSEENMTHFFDSSCKDILQENGSVDKT